MVDMVEGTRYASLESGSTDALIVGREGVSVVTAAGATTVRFTDCRALLQFPDGARHLIGADGVLVAVEPALWALNRDAYLLIDSQVPAAYRYSRPARDPGSIPKPGMPRQPAVEANARFDRERAVEKQELLRRAKRSRRIYLGWIVLYLALLVGQAFLPNGKVASTTRLLLLLSLLWLPRLIRRIVQTRRMLDREDASGR
jgi:hypothetical protein